jgi:hypothetical protein
MESKIFEESLLKFILFAAPNKYGILFLKKNPKALEYESHN